MRSYIHWADDQAEVEAEIASCPKKPKPPISEKRFDKLVRLAAVGFAAGATVACTVFLGFPGLLFSGMIDVILAAIALID